MEAKKDDQEGLLHFLYQSPVAIVRIDGDGHISMLNPKAAALTQSLGLLSTGPQAGRVLLQELDPQTSEETWAALGQIGVVASRRQVKRCDLDGVIRHLALTVHVVTPGSCMVTLEDTTELQATLASLREGQRRYKDLLETIPAGVVIHGPGSEIRIANTEASRILGLSVEQLLGLEAIDSGWKFLRADGTVLPLSEYPVCLVLSTKRSLKNYVCGIRKPGVEEPVWVIVNASPEFNADGDVLEVCVGFTEISELKRTEEKLSESEERYRLVLKGSNDAPWDCDLIKNTVYYSPRFWEMLGMPPDVTCTDSNLWQSLIHPDDRERVIGLIHEALGSGKEGFEIEYRFVQPCGLIVDVLSRGFILRDSCGRPIRMSGTLLDLRERKQAEKEIQRLAFSDPLTNLPNRRRLLDKAQEAIVSGSRSGLYAAMLFIDLDRFKEINDTRGHDYGDRILKKVAVRLKGCTRESDTVARLGGDEFVVLLEHLSREKEEAAMFAEKVARNFLKSLEKPFDLGFERADYCVTASVGITIIAPMSISLEKVMKEADLAMYRAKDLGGQRINFFEEDMQKAVEERVALEVDLRSALKNNNLSLHYQVQVSRDQRAIGAEVLMRWRHPVRGYIPPSVFIPIAEESDLILGLGRWALREACSQLAKWRMEKILSDLTLSVNVSVHQLHQSDFVETVLRIVSETGADPCKLKLEITESAMAKNIDDLIFKMSQLKNHGINFSLDDFGTGYSSLSYLKKLPLDDLKIDVEFVRNLATDPDDASMVRTILNLSQHFNLESIAEGVETQTHVELLDVMGCCAYQGYYFSRPQPVGDFEELVKSKSWQKKSSSVHVGGSQLLSS